MSIIVIVLSVVVLLFIAYRTYGTFLAKKIYELDDSRKTAAVELEDDVDFIPTESKFLLGQHFSAIAAAGPITGPIIAGIAYGWLPATIWILLGSVFMGGVQDMGAMISSVREKGKSIADTVRQNVSKSAWILFNLFILVTLVSMIVAFIDLTTSSFVNQIDIGNGEMVGGGAIATSSMIYLALPIIMGLLLRYTRLSLGWATAIFLPLVAVAIWVGPYIPFDLQKILGLETALQAQKIWNTIVLIYCVVAALLPVWLLLQPRGHLGGYFLYVSVSLAAIGVLFGGFKVSYPAFTTPIGEEGFWTPMLPMLFITIACGAVSGFHSLVSSGTTSKQIKKEGNTKLIGYGAMLMEAVVAMIALSTLMILTTDSELLNESPNFIYASGIGSFMELIGFDPAFGVAFGLMAFSTFVFDTLDICTRLGRYIIQELTAWKGWFGKIIATVIMGGMPMVLMLITLEDEAGNPVPAWEVFWKTFGASNQLLAALALIGVTVWLLHTAKNKQAWLFTLIPAIIMFFISSWALIIMFVDYTVIEGEFAFPANANIIIPISCLVYLALAIWMAVVTARAVFKHAGSTKGRITSPAGAAD